ncbi:MAG: hypothetical protein ACTS73_05390 [Arsenophonus sp. NEOnobi-MAG3]
MPKVRRGDPQRQRNIFNSSFLSPYLKRAKGLEELLPWFYT